MDNTPLNKELIADTSSWGLYIRIDENNLDVMLYNPVEDNSLIYSRIQLDGSDKESYLKSLENAVYDNPLLLNDFSRTCVLIENKYFLLVPECVTDSDLQEKLFAEAHTDYDGQDSEIIADEVLPLHALMLMSVDRKLLGFIRRAFVNPRIYNHQTPLLRYFADRRRHGNNAKMFVHLRRENADIIVYDNDGLRLANTYSFVAVDDIIYYILAVRQEMGLDAATDELLISGEPELRRQISEKLKKFITFVMPVIFPGVMFRAGKNALSVPFDLIVIPLCE